MAETAVIHCPAGCRDRVSGEPFVTARFGGQPRLYLCPKCRGLWVMRQREHADGIVTPLLERVPV